MTLPLPSHDDVAAIRTIASHASHRAGAMVATALHALWQVKNDAEGIQPQDSRHAVVAYNGSVMENYPGYQSTCQDYLNKLAARSGATAPCILELEHAEESSLLGAAIAVACLDS
jgi:hexokinase